MTVTSRHSEIVERTQAARAHRRRLWCAAAFAIAAHATVYFSNRSLGDPPGDFGMEEPLQSVDVELVAQASEPSSPEPPEPPMPEPVPEPPKPEPVPEPPPEPPKPEEFATPTPPKPDPKPVAEPKPQRPKPATTKPSAPATTASSGGTPTGTSTASGKRTGGPIPTYKPSPAYPPESRAAGEQGVVMVRVVVDTSGRPSSVSLSRGSGHARLDRAALEAVRRWRFIPAMREGVPFALGVDAPVRFNLR